MGFSGGAKTVAIGLGGRKTISANHAKWNDPNARPGTYATNPMRQDVEEIGQLAGIHFALNAVLNANKEVVSVLAGAPEAVMQQGIAVAQSIFSAPIPAPYDLIIATPGGPPKISISIRHRKRWPTRP
jgi:nickel-dependent lactate racemase